MSYATCIAFLLGAIVEALLTLAFVWWQGRGDNTNDNQREENRP